MNLEVGMYVRTKYGYIAKIVKINDSSIYFDSQIFQASSYISAHKKILSKEKINQITIASHNLIDAIQVGDYVNGFRVEGVYNPTGNEVLWLKLSCNPIDNWENEDIKSVVTKEQFESMSYKVGE